MSKYSLNDLQEGMTILSSIMDKDGHTLISSNEKLNKKNIRLLKIWGIYEVDIKENNEFSPVDSLYSQYPREIVQKATELANIKFFFHKQDELGTTILKKIFIDQILEDGTLK
jgi:hypothetical protein